MLQLLRLCKAIPVWGWVLVALLAWIGMLNMRLGQAHRQVQVTALRADSVLAANDSTHQRNITNLGAVVSVYSRRVVQAEQRNGALEKDLRLTRRALYDATLRLGSFDSVLHDTVRVVERDVRVGQFRTYTPPFQVEADVRLPPPPGQGELALKVSLDTIPVRVSLGCAPRGPGGVRPAIIQAQTPPWASLDWTSVSQTPDICAVGSVLQPKKHSWLRDAAIALGAAIGTYFLVR